MFDFQKLDLRLVTRGLHHPFIPIWGVCVCVERGSKGRGAEKERGGVKKGGGKWEKEISR